MIWPDAFPKPIDAIESAAFLTDAQNQDMQDSETVSIIKSEMRLKPATSGDKRTVSFHLDLAGVESAAV
jgi:hypothetical protein